MWDFVARTGVKIFQSYTLSIHRAKVIYTSGLSRDSPLDFYAPPLLREIDAGGWAAIDFAGN